MTRGVCLNVHPDEVAHLETMQSRFVNRDGEPLTLHIEGDEAVGLGGCTIHADGLDIDASIEQQLHRLNDALVLQKEPDGSHVSTSSP